MKAALRAPLCVGVHIGRALVELQQNHNNSCVEQKWEKERADVNSVDWEIRHKVKVTLLEPNIICTVLEIFANALDLPNRQMC